jgi:preprotein translocase subunit SecD
MRGASSGWIVTILIAIFLSVVFLSPTFLGDKLPSWWKKVFPQKGLRLGLDLKGGVYLLLGVGSDKAIEHEITNMKESITDELNKDQILPKGFEIRDRTLKVGFFSEIARDKAEKLKSNYTNIADINESDASISFTLKDQYIKEVQAKAIDQVEETIGNRINEFGVVEPIIQKSGTDRIVIQVPGASSSDRERIINIIKRAAVLEFKIVKDSGSDEQTLLAKYGVKSPGELLSQGFMLQPGDPAGTGRENEKFFIMERDSSVTGQYLSDARLIFDEYGRPAVSFSFKPEGATRFGELTGKNVGKRLAIVLDGVVKSAPVIQERISSQGRITGQFSVDEAKDLALVLRSGALQVPVDIEQEQTVGPSLGRDSIEKGKLSMIVGGIAVFLFMIIFYKLQGVIADFALALNMFFMMGFLSAFGVTLTLPGIAGLVLTLGMAVDGNILIFERIKEELRTGKSPLASIDAGYARSLWTVIDTHITTLLTGVILFWFGTGAIKGFAVTLCIGIVSTLFSNVIVARVITDLIYQERKVEALSI